MNNEQLIEKAIQSMQSSYSPYSGFQVGAALLTADGTVYGGCNIENASYSLSVCAERVAFSRAIFDGHRKFTKIAIVGGANGSISSYTYPCGVCRQVMLEFCSGDFELVFFDGETILTHTLDEMMPYSFTSKNLDPA